MGEFMELLLIFFLKISLFWFGWTSGGNIHWISPILASVLWTFSAFILFQAGLKLVVPIVHVAINILIIVT